MNFSEFDLHPAVIAGLEKKKFDQCTPIQEAAVPPILEGKDVAGLAQTGTGKTAAFVVPLMDRLLRSLEEQPGGHSERAFSQWRASSFVLILVPTRELAEQVLQNVRELDGLGRVKAVAVYGGTSYEPQKKALAEGVHFVVATPGRLIDLFKDHVVDLSQARAVVFDEADRMFDMGFKDDMKYILKRIPRDRQFLVFSATLNFDVLNVAYEFGAEPVEINISRDQAKAENVDDEVFHVGDAEKPPHLLSLLKKYGPHQTIVFSNFKSNVERLALFLTQNGFPAVAISSLLSQNQRQRVMDQFKQANNDRNILVATDVAARGLDIKGVDMVVNYELPDDPENYVHRIGRTGRAGLMGKAFSLVSDRDVVALARIEDYLDHKVRIGWLDDAELVTEFKSFPARDIRFSAPKGHKEHPPKKPHGDDSRRRRGDQRGRGPREENRDSRPAASGKSDRKNRQNFRGPNGPNGPSVPRSESRGESQEARRETRPAAGVKPTNSGSAFESTHRDRRTGRHQNDSRHKPQPRSGTAKPGRTHLVRKGGQSRGRYKGGRYRIEPNQSNNKTAPSGLGQKISGFFKSLFGK